jgi:hypothetical protein
MSAVVKNKLLLYADDSGILVSGKILSVVEKALTDDMELVSQWLVDNKLSLHLGKTESILFRSRQKLRSQSNLHITCSGTPIESTSSIKYLGITIDQNLSFCSMTESVLKKANSRLKFLYRKKEFHTQHTKKFLYRKKEFVTQHTKKFLVMSLIQCHYDYACSVWYSSLTQSLKNKLQTCQNKIMRFVLNLDSRAHIDPSLFKSLNWLPVHRRVEQIMLCYIFKIKNGLSPDYMSEHFISQDSVVHNYSTRLSQKGGYCVP